MKKKRIERKILSVAVGISVVSLAAFCAVAFRGLYSVRAHVLQSSAKLGESAAANSGRVLEQEAVGRLLDRAQGHSRFINERLTGIAKDAVYFAGHVTEIYKSAGKLAPVYIPYASSENNGKLVMWMASANGAADYPRIRGEAGLLGNVKPAFVSNADDMEALTRSLYLATESGFIISYDRFSDDRNRIFDPRARRWYRESADICRAYGDSCGTGWTDPYNDASSEGKLLVTCSHPFKGADGSFKGMVGIDLFIEDLNTVVNVDSGKYGHAVVVNRKATVIASSDMKRRPDGVFEAKSAYVEGNAEYNSVIDRMTGGESGSARVGIDGKEMYMAYACIPVTGWSVALMRPVSEVMGPVTENSAAIESMTKRSLGAVNNAIMSVLIAFVVGFALVVAAVIYLARMLSAKISRPIVTLEGGLARIAGGELDTRIALKTGDEIEQLGDSVNAMARELKKYISNLQRVTADKERISAELGVATKIQESMLPRVFPPFPGRPEFDIYASMEPAKEVGGDFYDFFFVEDNTLAVIVADVSGKGVPAALFMVVAKTLIKNNAQCGWKCAGSPKEVFEKVNGILCDGNDTGMFVTAFMGYLDTGTGKFRYVNAGHTPPILITGGKCAAVKVKPGFVLAGLEDTRYTEGELTMRPGDGLFLYTDGITEAVNGQNALFGQTRLAEAVNVYNNLPLKEFTSAIKREIDKFAGGAEQADDITMLALRYTSTAPSDGKAA
ncbi:MAG: SpoIIE family protein phosphatase [Chitinispirillales bacterium]|jgi:sigma-B regulation protein RsbU (phosphoserine phosphatase)|nr:SpoIIE family protein phosphatase [Chitinispirillales bacterium]